VLHIVRVSRLHMGAYLCIASNGVPPSISKRVVLRVQCKLKIFPQINILYEFCYRKMVHCYFNTLRTGSFELFKRPFPGFLTILSL